MDIICPKCRQPWDMEELHDNELGLEYSAAAKKFRTEGCGEVFGNSYCKPDAETDPIIAVIYELMDDDMDGAASMLEDAEFMGII